MGELIREFDKTVLYREKVKHIGVLLLRHLQKGLEWVPIKRNRISMISLTHKGYGDNMKYLTEYLKQSGNYEIVWITRYPQQCREISGVRVIRAKSVRHFIWQFTSGILFSDDYLYVAIMKRKRQIYINTWHGGINYKKVGYEGLVFETAFQKEKFALQNEKPQYMIAGSRFFEENMKAAFQIENTVFLETGLPRNDVLYVKNAELEKRIRKKLRLENKKILLYAPTFRSAAPKRIPLELKEVLEALKKRYGGDWAALYRAHYFADGSEEFESGDIINVSDYGDMQELLLVSDYMISDYSSCMWDFLLRKKPCVIYAPDYEQYCREDRGLTAAGRSMPYPMAKNMEELTDIIQNYDEAAESRKNEIHIREMGTFDRGNAAEMIEAFMDKLR